MLRSSPTGLTETMPKTFIRPSRGWVSLRLRDVWAYRELVLFLTWRDISVRYKQTVLGAAWAVLQPFFSMVVFSIFFGRLAAVPSDDLPYPLFSYAGLLPWQYFATAMANSSESLIGSEKLITKVYFPRLVIPIAAVLPAAVASLFEPCFTLQCCPGALKAADKCGVSAPRSGGCRPPGCS